jgi:transposase
MIQRSDCAKASVDSRQLVVPDNIAILTLPAYSPELNPMENVWDYLRQHKLC